MIQCLRWITNNLTYKNDINPIIRCWHMLTGKTKDKIHVGVAIVAIAVNLLIIDALPLEFLTIQDLYYILIPVIISGSVFAGLLASSRHRYIAMSITHLKIHFELGQRMGKGDGNQENAEETIELLRDIVKEAERMVEKLPWWIAMLKGASIVLGIATIILGIVTYPATAVLLVVSVIAFFGVLAVTALEIRDDRIEAGELELKKGRLERLQS